MDEEGHLRVKGKNETDHNTIITTIATNLPRKKTIIKKWNLNNKEGWENFNKEMNTREEELRNKEYPDLEKEVIEIMKKTVGKTKIRTDKEPKPNNTQIKEAKGIRKEKKATYQKSIKENLTEKKKEALTEYIEAQKNLRTAIEEHENKKTEEKIEQITKMAQINPNTIWNTRKRTRTDNELSYATITEEGTTITDPEKTKEHIAEYFEDLYQARPGTPEYENWTKYIETEVKKALQSAEQTKEEPEQITPKELGIAIKKLKSKKSLGPDDIPNETFIEANKKTRDIFREAFNRIHVKEEIPKSWQKPKQWLPPREY